MADIRHAIQIAAAPEVVFSLAATADGFRHWWAADVTEADGVVELAFFGRATVYRLRLMNREAQRRAEWLCESGKEWAGTHLRFLLEAKGDGTALHFTHAGWESETPYFISCNTTWGELMFRLKSAAEGEEPGPLFLADGMAY